MRRQFFSPRSLETGDISVFPPEQHGVVPFEMWTEDCQYLMLATVNLSFQLKVPMVANPNMAFIPFIHEPEMELLYNISADLFDYVFLMMAMEADMRCTNHHADRLSQIMKDRLARMAFFIVCSNKIIKAIKPR